MTKPIYQECKRCLRSWPIQMFFRDRYQKSGRAKYCKMCEKEKFRGWYEANAERIRAKSRERKRVARALTKELDVSQTEILRVYAAQEETKP